MLLLHGVVLLTAVRHESMSYNVQKLSDELMMAPLV